MHWKAAKGVLRYLQGTLEYKLTYRRTQDQLTGYADADWGNCNIDRRSYSGYVFTLSGAAVTWASKKQRTIALSSVEAEYLSLSEAAKEALYLRRLLDDMGFPITGPMTLYNDSQGAQMLITNPVYHSRTKHIDIRNQFIKHQVDEGLAEIKYLKTEEMPADFLTKPLNKKKLLLCSLKSGVGPG